MAKENKDKNIPVCQKVCLTIEEASEYSNIGINKLQEETRKPNCRFVIYVGKKKLIKRKAFEEFIEKTLEI